jgi:hypothetical protein
MERLRLQLVGSISGARRRTEMKRTIIALSAVALIAASPIAFAAQGVSSKTPGHEMQTKGAKRGYHGASGYAPGREMQARGSVRSHPGASGYAPGQTTGANTKSGY